MKKILILFCLLPLMLAATDYTLDELVEYGLEHSWTMQKSALDFENAASSFRSAKWDLLPELKVNAGINADFTDPVAPASDLSSYAGFSISKTISLNDPDYFAYKYSRLDKQTAMVELSESQSAYVYQVMNAYIDVLSAQTQLSSLNKNLEIQLRVWEQSKALLELGKTTTFDTKQNEIAVMNSRITIIKMQNTIETNRRKLFSLIQMSDQGYPLTDITAPETMAVPELDLDSIASLKVLEQQIDRNDISLQQSFLSYFPQVSLSYNFNRKVSGPDFEFNNYSTVHGANLDLSYSLWNQFRQGENAARARTTKRIAMLNLESKKDDIQSQYTQASTQLEYLLRLDTLYSEKLSQSAEQIRIAEERYRLGLIELLELDKTRVDYIDADIAYNTNRYQIIQTRENLNYLLSESLMGKW